MSDPYKVLGVEFTASDDEIKQVYRELAKKYHPDNYVGSPLSDLAGEKMAEINAAYDAVQEERRRGTQNGATGSAYGQGGYQSGGYQSSGGQFDDIRRLITMGRMFEAEELLNGVPTASRTAEWHFLKGNTLYSRGFLEDALQHLQTAVGLDPQNLEYRNTLDVLMRQRQYGYGKTSGPVATGGCSPCGLCSTLCCLDCTCRTCRCCCN